MDRGVIACLFCQSGLSVLRGLLLALWRRGVSLECNSSCGLLTLGEGCSSFLLDAPLGETEAWSRQQVGSLFTGNPLLSQ